MEGITIDLTAVAVVWMVGVLLLVPLVGFTLRFGVIPLLATVTELRRGRTMEDGGLSKRVRELEERLRELESRQAKAERGVGVA
jgi:hypothetical protein